jgi:hypothetical protein
MEGKDLQGQDVLTCALLEGAAAAGVGVSGTPVTNTMQAQRITDISRHQPSLSRCYTCCLERQSLSLSGQLHMGDRVSKR